jgi:inhibitor of KinA
MHAGAHVCSRKNRGLVSVYHNNSQNRAYVNIRAVLALVPVRARPDTIHFETMRFAPLGDHAIMITVGSSIDEVTNGRVRALSAALHANPPAGSVDQVPAFASLVLHYDPALVSGDQGIAPYDRMVQQLETLFAVAPTPNLGDARLVEIPVCYGGAFGPDIEDVAKRHELEAEDVIRIHTAGDYLVYMVGFMPGFAYLGGLSERIATPRRGSPRTAVPAGTVGIGGDQTGVYPLVSPGGWNLIGKTPLRIFDIQRSEPTLLAAGDRVRFRQISLSEFSDWPT